MKLFRLFVAFILVCFTLSPSVQGVLPPPPGGYPNFTTAAGDHALQALTLGVGNTAIGTFSLFSVTTGNFNTAVGAGSLDLNQADSNTATGTAALLFNTTGAQNTAIGTAALEFNTTGLQNAANGAFALFSNVGGSHNTAVGANALFANTASSNTGIGDDALANNSSGQFNVAIGDSAGANSTGDSNIMIGTGSGNNVTTAANVICIGSSGANVDHSCYIGNIFGATIDPATAIIVGTDSSGKLGTVASSQRFKRDIHPIERASESILKLKPVTFHYKTDAKNTPCFGLIAEDVAETSPELVVRDKEGKPYSVRYDQVNAMLLNEFLKARRQIDAQQKQIDALTAAVQKVSAQLDLSKPASQTVVNVP